MTTDVRTQALLEMQIVATLASSVIAAMGRPVSTGDVQRIVNEIHMTMFPQAGSGRYEAFKESHDHAKAYD